MYKIDILEILRRFEVFWQDRSRGQWLCEIALVYTKSCCCERKDGGCERQWPHFEIAEVVQPGNEIGLKEDPQELSRRSLRRAQEIV